MDESHEPPTLARPDVTPRHRGVRPVFLLSLALVLAFAVLVATRVRPEERDATRRGRSDWFSVHKARCNAVEVGLLLSAAGPLPGVEGDAQRVTCLAIAGKVEAARQLIFGMAPTCRNVAVNYLFTVVHPIADAGDDASAGPIMELVVEFQPEHFMALYHAGMATAITGNDGAARGYLTRFLALYQTDDGWNYNARKALEALDRPRTQRTVKQGSEGSFVY